MQKQYRTIWLSPLVLCLAWWLNGSALGADTFGYTSLKPQLWETERPALERDPGRNLFWHDPFLGHRETCRDWPPAANGCAPTWYSRSELLALWRDDSDSIPFATEGPAGPVVLASGDFETEADAGLRILIGRALGDWYRLEAAYFGSFAWDDTIAARNQDTNDQGEVGNLYSPFSQFGDPTGTIGLDYNELATLRIRSRLNNGELNLRRRILMRPGYYELSCLVGGRYIDLDEQFQYAAVTNLPGPLPRTNDILIDTQNKLIGLQVGATGQYLIQPRCWIDCEIKGGIYQNEVALDRTFTVTDTGGAFNQSSGSDQRNRTSFGGDISLQFNYQFASAWTFQAGYNAVWITGVALGAQNFTDDVNLLSVGPTYVDHTGQVLYHGPNIGLTFAW
jgi:hypothetical protein